MNIKTSFRAAALGGAIVFASLAGGAAQAHAAGFKGLASMAPEITRAEVLGVAHRFKRRWRLRPFHKRHDGCGFYKWKWHHTGAYFWKKKYFICKGWW